ncbi:3-phosphoglycerate dehydrogenase [Apibacter muscae]|uniref:3-phosphoglycerate dehydrogenase n=1 Tax=Apibacter muscae TaxID=2509004 RepID=A0A563D8Y0_9FLAO|nr:D-2-hydroxyacid dehydrogenase [Apibacter muscae]TWP22536.1 3-phosphoglycerate dehydrogenase [Apibacter muscae]TWP26738.1 3-phosphoglycerate dehydrogenase [Apibacter muscae]TWP27631.1 3-phosphoglycerate dehydrogenase [Apibacter muscae]
MKILPNDGISSNAIEALEKAGHEVLNQKVAQEQLVKYINENEIDVLLVRSATKVRKELIDECPSIKIIGRGGVGMDNIDVTYAKEKGIHVINTPAASSRSVAELVFGHMLSLYRYLQDSNRNMPLEGDKNFSALKKSYAGAMELGGKTLGVIGFGRIGIEVVKLGLAFGMKVLVADAVEITKTVTLDFYDGQKVNFEITTVPMDELLKNSDAISVHVPKQPKYVIGKDEISKMKPNAIIVNAARGGVIDEVALVDALKENKLFGAALDVFENEPNPEITLLMDPKLSLSPHIGGNTKEAQERVGLELAEQIIELAKK